MVPMDGEDRQANVVVSVFIIHLTKPEKMTICQLDSYVSLAKLVTERSIFITLKNVM
jgi:hypothetical protein